MQKRLQLYINNETEKITVARKLRKIVELFFVHVFFSMNADFVSLLILNFTLCLYRNFVTLLFAITFQAISFITVCAPTLTMASLLSILKIYLLFPLSERHLLKGLTKLELTLTSYVSKLTQFRYAPDMINNFPTTSFHTPMTQHQ